MRIFDRTQTWWRQKNEEALGSQKEKYRCGTLHYTPASLLVLFAWLLWGDFTFSLMEALPSLWNMQLKDHGMSNQTIALLTTTIYQLSNIALNPVISSYSDRFRGRWGRRRPFLLFATPFVSLFLVLIPWSPEISRTLEAIPLTKTFLEAMPCAPIVFVFGILILAFQIFNLFICTTYYYLIPDTVPEPFIGRFYGLFRLFGIFAGIIFNWFVFGHAHEHMRAIFAFFGLLYCVSFVLMCVNVKEGEYPEVLEDRQGWLSPVKNYITQCFGSGRSWLIFLVYGSIQWASAIGVFTLFFYRDQIGLTETEFGRLTTMTLVASLVLSAPFGSLIDRLGSQRSLAAGLIGGCILYTLGAIFIQDRISAFVIGFLLNIPGFLIFLSLGKWTADMYPRANYGQFASAGAIVGAVGVAILSPLGGMLVDALGNQYRLCLVFPAVCYAAGLCFALILASTSRPVLRAPDMSLENP